MNVNSFLKEFEEFVRLDVNSLEEKIGPGTEVYCSVADKKSGTNSGVGAPKNEYNSEGGMIHSTRSVTGMTGCGILANPDFNVVKVRELKLLFSLVDKGHGAKVAEHIYNASVRDSIYCGALSMLVSEFPVQTINASLLVRKLVSQSILSIKESRWKKMCLETIRDPYPLKKIEYAENKTNLYFSEVWSEVKRSKRVVAEEWARHAGHTRAFSNDQATAALIYAVAIFPHYKLEAVKWAILSVIDPGNAKGVSLVCKSLGANSTIEGACVCEADVMIGRAAKDVDAFDDMKRRFEHEHDSQFKCPLGPLREAIREIVKDELADTPTFRPVAEFWSSRWGWCVNGSHSLVRQHALELEGKEDKFRIDSKLLPAWHRRAALEQMTNNPMDWWDGRVFVSVSKKLEAGKTRMLYACDTISYVCWQHFLEGVEGVWRGKNVLLDPGADGHDGLHERIRARDGAGSVYVMLDYSDFNSQHTLDAMRIVVEEVAMACDYDQKYTERLISSLYKQEVWFKGVKQGVVASTLMSGHRGTTFFNSILNRAYILVAEPRLARNSAMLHTGDDVICKALDFDQAFKLLRACKDMGIKINVLKQSVGTITGEFTRMAMCGRVSRGYVTRSIAGFVAGNWYTDHRLDPLESMRGMVSNARALVNRSENREASILLVPSVMRVTGLGRQVAIKLLEGSVSLMGSPAYNCNGKWYEVEVEIDTSVVTRDKFINLAGRATCDFLSHHMSEVERYAINYSGISVQAAMLESSYGKSMLDNSKPTEMKLRVVKTVSRVCDAKVTLRERRKRIKQETKKLRHHGKALTLQHFPLLYYMKKRIDRVLLERLVSMVGGATNPESIRRAFELDRLGLCIEGYASYSDASSLCVDIDGKICAVYTPEAVCM